MNANKPANTNTQDSIVWLVRALLGLVAVLTLVWIGMGVAASLAGEPEAAWVDDAIFLSIWLVNGAVAFLILSRYPRHVVGWLLLALSLILVLTAVSTRIIYLTEQAQLDPANPLVKFFVWMSLWIWYPNIVIVFVFIPLYFPDGRLLSRRWRYVTASAVFVSVGNLVVAALHPGPVAASAYPVENPYPFTIDTALATFLLETILVIPMPPLIVSVVGSLVLRYRRSRLVARTQIKWVVFAIILLICGWIGLLALDATSPFGLELPEETYSWLGIVAIIAIPAVIGVSILRYNLFDIDLIIRRTLVYGLSSALLAGVYFGSVVLLQTLVGAVSGQSAPAVIVVSTLIIAALFNPLRLRVQGTIDRRFYRKKYDAERALAQFAAVARDEVDLDRLSAALLEVVEETIQPAAVSLTLVRQEVD